MIIELLIVVAAFSIGVVVGSKIISDEVEEPDCTKPIANSLNTAWSEHDTRLGYEDIQHKRIEHYKAFYNINVKPNLPELSRKLESGFISGITTAIVPQKDLNLAGIEIPKLNWIIDKMERDLGDVIVFRYRREFIGFRMTESNREEEF